ncbi:hypothetical protein H2198_004633 [Neophaeococcomyces mojaviensis]|uniref:Uncharacterized protein n=1 Tax=Neophaeococcomyces mojaviensis TaxID=3383035 RepID=A0ACC3A7W3_9EURO|nr:hypothetical protein H2198_004633 [Knufia sp. JES_112]
MAAQMMEEAPPSPTENKQLPTPPPELATPSKEEEPNSVASEQKAETTVAELQQESSATSLTDKTDESKNSKVEAKTESPKSEGKSKAEVFPDDAKPEELKLSDKDSKKLEEGSKSETETEKDSDKDKEKSKDDVKSDDKDEKQEEKKLTPRGMKAELKTLWAKTDAQCKCCTTWVEKNPDDGTNVEESDECKQHAVIVRKKKKHEGNRKPLKVDSIVVHSPLLKKVLQKLFQGYPDLVIDLDELVFDAPFSPFFHRWEKFEQLRNETKDETTKSHLGLLYDALALELKPVIQRHKDLIRHKAIDFEILWTLFTPGDLMYSHDNGHDRLYRTADCEYWQDLSGMKFTIRCDMIDWDGEKFGKITMSEQISKFKGTKQITSLPSYPLQFHQKAEEMKNKCIERGRRFRDLAGTNCKDYKGTAIEYMKFSYQTVTSKRAIEGRIMLDEELFAKFNPDEQQVLNELNEDDDMKTAAVEETENEEDEEKGKDDKVENAEEGKTSTIASADKTSEIETPSETDKAEEDAEKTKESSKTTVSEPESKNAEPTPGKTSEEAAVETKDDDVSLKEENKSDPDAKPDLTEDQLAICTSWLRGYSLTYQKWASFAVDNVSDVTWNENAFSELTLPAEYRELILATIQSQIKQNKWKQKVEKAFKNQKPIENDDQDDNPAEFDDFIAQKGLGYIMLFSGNPGVGKTATAESIAELLHVPLCMVSVGNLGTSAESVESSLQDILELASKWNAVLLLDEADIFLEQRTKHDLHRNAVVSVFLRLLEYYQGVMCLTTNRAEEIDVAFHSRIHISLPFPDLTENNREQIWRHFTKITNKKADARRTPSTPATTTPPTGTETDPETTHGSKTPSSAGIATPATSVSEDPHCENSLIDLTATDFRKLSQTPLNGRQIKNAFKTAVLLASYKKEKVQMKHIKTALKTIDGGMGGFGRKGDLGRMYY